MTVDSHEALFQDLNQLEFLTQGLLSSGTAVLRFPGFSGTLGVSGLHRAMHLA